MMIHLEYSTSHRRRLVTIPADSLHLLPPLNNLLLPILDEPGTLISVLFNSLVLHGLVVAAHDFPEIFHVMRLGSGVSFPTEAAIRHRQIAFEGGAIRLLFPLYFSLVKGTMPCQFLLKKLRGLQDFGLVQSAHWGRRSSRSDRVVSHIWHEPKGSLIVYRSTWIVTIVVPWDCATQVVINILLWILSARNKLLLPFLQTWGDMDLGRSYFSALSWNFYDFFYLIGSYIYLRICRRPWRMVLRSLNFYRRDPRLSRDIFKELLIVLLPSRGSGLLWLRRLLRRTLTIRAILPCSDTFAVLSLPLFFFVWLIIFS